MFREKHHKNKLSWKSLMLKLFSLLLTCKSLHLYFGVYEPLFNHVNCKN